MYQNFKKEFFLNKNYIVFVIGKSFLMKCQDFKSLIFFLKKEKKKIFIIKNLSEEIHNKEIDSAYKKIRHLKKAHFIAVGGGGTIDAGKILSLMFKKKVEKSWEFFLNKDLINKKNLKNAKLYALPTTSGSGSEATPFIVLYNEAFKVKKAIATKEVLPSIIFFNYSFIKNMPRLISVNSAMDALGQAIESLISKKRNKYSEKFAYKTINLIIKYLPLLVINKKNTFLIREKLFTASIYSGKSIKIAETNLAHAICDSLGPLTKLNHGLLVGTFTPICFNFFKRKNFENRQINKIEKIFKENNYKDITNFYSKFLKNKKINLKLNMFKFYKIKQKILNVGSMKNCISIVTNDELSKILLKKIDIT